MRIKDIVLIGMLGALLVTVQIGIAFIPNVELVSILMIIFTVTMRKKAIFIIAIFILLEGLFYGIGLWWINYLYIWYILFLISYLFRKERSPVIWGIISGSFGLSFGALCAIPYFFIGYANGSFSDGIHMVFAYWVSGIPFDLIHGVANFTVALILFKPLYLITSKLVNSDYQIARD